MTAAGTRPRIGFLFPGQSSEYAGMGVELYREHPVFRAAIDRPADVFRRLTGVGPLDVFADAAAQTRAELLQPAVFLLQVALAEFWAACGVTPDAVIGHSLGEYAAACVAGVFSAEEGLELVSARGRSFAAVPGAGRMVAVGCPDPAELERLVAAHGDAATVAAYNAPERFTVSGTDAAMRELGSAFEQRGWLTVPLETTHAFHSALVAPAVPALVVAAGRIAHRPPAVPLALNLTGAWASGSDLGAEYWGRQLTSPVRFLSGIRRLLDSGCTVFLEVGPGRTLTTSGRRAQPGGVEVWLPGLSARNPDPATVLEHLDRLERAGVPVDWAKYYAPFRPSKVSAPAVPSASDLPELTRLALPRSVQRRYQTTVATRAPRMLADHEIAGRRVVPGAYHMACLVEAVAGESAAVVEDLVFPQAQEIAAEACRVQLVLTPDGDHRFVAQSLGLVREDEPFVDASWQVHAEGRIQRSDIATAPPRPWTDPAGHRAGRPVSAAEIYLLFEANGLRFGPAFQWIRELRLAGEDTTGDLVIATSSPRERTMALLDSCIQLAIAGRIVRKTAGDGVLLPFRIERGVFHASRSAAESGVALVRHRAVGAALAVVDVSLTDDAGHSLVELFGLELRAVSPSTADPLSPKEAERLLASFHSLTQDQIEALLPGLADDVVGSTDHDIRTKLEATLRSRAGQARTEYPLSYAQRSLLMLHQMNPDSASYNVAFTARFIGGLDSAKLHRAVQSLVGRHAALRTTFSRMGTGGPDDTAGHQTVHGWLEPDFAELDARQWTGGQLDEAVRTAHREPFDLAAGPLIRVRVYHVAPGEAVVLLALHHVVCDFWSLGIIVAELEQLYLAEAERRRAELPERNVPYSDFVAHQSRLIAGPKGARARAYWHTQLSGRLEPTEWPRFDLDPADAGEGRSVVFPFPAVLAHAVVALAKEEGVTPYVVLLTAFQILVSRYTGQEDVLLGAPVAGRTDRTMTECVGNFVNPVVLRADLSGAESFREQLGRTRRTVLQALEHQGYPFELLVSELAPRRMSDRNPVFQAMFGYQKPSRYPAHAGLYVADEGAAPVAWAGLTAVPFRLDQQDDQLELALEIVHDGDRLVGLLKHRTSVFSTAAARRMTEHYLTLLRAAIDGPGRSVADLPLRTEADDGIDRHATSVSVALDDSLAVRFRTTAEQHADRVAVSCAGDRLSYAELDDLAGRWAARLRVEGVRPGSRVALLLEPSIDTVVAIVAVQRAGAAYVVLDSSYPAARCRMVLENSQARVVLTQPDLAGMLADAAVPVLVMPETDLPPAGEPGDLPSAGDVAYTVYTSGSTGTPKGIDVEHGNVLSLIDAMREHVVMDETAVGALFHSTGFDLSVWEVWGTLLAGARLVVVPSTAARSPDLFHTLLVEERITHIVQTPSALDGLAAVVRQNGPQGLALRHVFSCGEPLPAPLARTAREWCGTLWNMYGPAETTVWVTAQAIRAEDCAGTGVPVGLPLANTRIYVLDEHGRPMPPEFTGELHIGGQCVARGYVNQPQLTKERFLDSHFEPHGRLYRTGDLARVNSHGLLEILGRVDNQVKISGFRIELEEVEAQLDALPGVRRSTALVVGTGAVDRRLVACVIPEPGRQLTETALKAELRSSLPPYMVPAAIGFFDTFPLNASQKVDRAQLAGQFADAVARTEPGLVVTLSAHERRVAGIWQQVLQRPGIGREDNFFDLGGTSMLLMKVHQQLLAGDAADPSLKVSELFRYPTVASLAARLGRVPAARAGGADRDRTSNGRAQPVYDTVRGARLRARGRIRPSTGGDANA